MKMTTTLVILLVLVGFVPSIGEAAVSCQNSTNRQILCTESQQNVNGNAYTWTLDPSTAGTLVFINSRRRIFNCAAIFNGCASVKVSYFLGDPAEKFASTAMAECKDVNNPIE